MIELTHIERSYKTAAEAATALQDVWRKLDPDLPVKIGSWQQVLGMELFPPVAATVAVGALGSLAAMLAATLRALSSRLLAHVVYGATSQDPVVLAGVAGSMALLALAATWLPARRALHADPAQLLREE